MTFKHPATTTGWALTNAADAKAAKAAINADFFVSVKDYGAVGDGVADDTAAVHAARDAAGAKGTVFFPKGTYRVGSLIANVSGQTWNLGGATLSYAGASTADFLKITASDVTISGGTLDLSSITPNVTTAECQGILIDSRSPSNGDGAVIKDVVIKNAPGHAIWALNASNVTVAGCTITDQYWTGIFVSNNSSRPDTYDFLFQDNKISTSSIKAKGICLHTNSELRSINRARIIGNRVTMLLGDNSPNMECINAFWSKDCVIANNVIYGGRFSISTAESTRFVISHNICRGFRYLGVEITGYQYGTTVTGNIIDGDGYATSDLAAGIQGSGATGVVPVKDVAITGNTIRGFTGSNRAIGISIGSNMSVDGMTISGNTISGVGGTGEFHGIRVNNSTSSLTITGNLINCDSRSLSNGVTFNGGNQSGISITGNNFVNCARAALGMYLLGTGVFNSIRFTGNTTRNCGAATNGDGIAAATSVFLDSDLATLTGINTSGSEVRNAIENLVGDYQPETISLLDRMSVRPDGDRRIAIDNLIKNLKNNGIWSKLDSLYLFAAHTQQAALLNWCKNSANFSTINSPTFTVDVGFTGLGASGASLTNTNAATVNAQPLDVMTAVWMSKVPAVDEGYVVWWTGWNWYFSHSSTSVTWNLSRSSANGHNITTSSRTGLFTFSRTGANTASIYRDGAKIATDTKASDSSGSSTAQLRLFSTNGSTTAGTSTMSCVAYGSSLDDSKMALFYNAVNDYMTAVNLSGNIGL